MITELTKKQKDRFLEFVDKWIKIGLCTEPANRKVAERAVINSYKIAGLNPPKKIVWCGSPLSQGLTRAIVFGLNKSEIKIGKSIKLVVPSRCSAKHNRGHQDKFLGAKECGLVNHFGDKKSHAYL